MGRVVSWTLIAQENIYNNIVWLLKKGQLVEWKKVRINYSKNGMGKWDDI